MNVPPKSKTVRCLVIGKATFSMGRRQTAIGTLVEGHTRYVMLFPLPDGNTAESVRTQLAATVQRLPEHLWKSLIWDQGEEMAQHAQFSIDTGIQAYFCDPKSPWQRGSNEKRIPLYPQRDSWVGPPGLEPGTSSLSEMRSNRAELWAQNTLVLTVFAALLP